MYYIYYYKYSISMRIGFDAKTFYNQTGLETTPRSIRILSQYYPDNDYFLYTPKLLKQ